jgi:hypothetical protein
VFVDPIALLTLVFTVIAALAAVVGVLIGLRALYYAKRGPTRGDVAEVKREVAAVREHTAATEGHLAEQKRRQLLLEHGAGVSITVTAVGFVSEPLVLIFTLKDQSVTLLRADLINRLHAPLGTLRCVLIESLLFSASIDSELAGQWFMESEIQESFNLRLARIRTYFEIDGTETSKEFSVTMTRTPRQRLAPVTAEHGFELHGGC